MQDIGSTCAAELLSTGKALPSTPYIYELHGPRPYTSLDVQRAFEEVSGKSVEVRPVEKAGLLDFYRAFLSPTAAKYFTEMNESFLPGGILYEDPNPTGEIRYGKTELVEAVRKMYGA